VIRNPVNLFKCYLKIIFINLLFILSTNTFFFYYLKNSDKAFLYVKFDLFKIALSTVLSLYFVLSLKIGIWGIASAQAISLIVIFGSFALWFGLPAIFIIDWKILKESFSYGWPLMTKVFLNVLNVSIDKLMVGKMVSLGALGIYSRAQSIAYSIFNLMTSVQNVYGPEWNRILFGKQGSENKSISKSFTEYVCIISIPAAGLIIFCKEFLSFLLPKEYYGAMVLVVVLAYYYALLSFGKMQGAVGAYLKMSKFMALMMFISYPLNIGLNVLLIPRYGALGSVTSTLTVGIIMLVLNQLNYGRKYKTNFEAKKLFGIFGIIAIGCIVSIAGINGLLNKWIEIPIKAALFVVFFSFIIHILGIQKIRGLLSGKGIRPSA